MRLRLNSVVVMFVCFGLCSACYGARLRWIYSISTWFAFYEAISRAVYCIKCIVYHHWRAYSFDGCDLWLIKSIKYILVRICINNNELPQNGRKNSNLALRRIPTGNDLYLQIRIALPMWKVSHNKWTRLASHYAFRDWWRVRFYCESNRIDVCGRGKDFYSSWERMGMCKNYLR